MLLRIDPSSTEPLYLQLAASVRGAVVRGEIGTGHRLPPAKEVAAALDVNVHTVLHAYQELREEGVIDLRRGRGAVVAASAEDYAALRSSLTALAEEARRLGVPRRTVLSLLHEEMS